MAAAPPDNAAAPAATRAEARALTLSLTATAVLGIGAIIWGVVTDTRVILFDGVYMLAGIVLVAVSMLASRAAASAPTREYPFGRPAATPLAVGLQGAALLGAVAYGIADAVALLLDGGSDAAATMVLFYGLVSTAASLLVMLALRAQARVSALVRAELVSWRAGALLSAVVAAGGLLGVALSAMGNDVFVAYLDPVLVLIACAVVIPMAVGLVREGVRELLGAAPAEPLRTEIGAAIAAGVVASAGPDHALPEPIVRARKLGRRLYIEVDFVVGVGQWSVDDEDVVRRSIIDRLDALGYEVWATVELTTDPTLVAD